MKKIEQNIITFLLVLIGLEIVDMLLTLFLFDIIEMIGFINKENIFKLFMKYLHYFSNLIFSIILLIYCRKQIKNKITIPILGFFYPVFGLIFYFIQSELILKNQKTK